MIPRFGLFTAAALALFILLGIFHREAPPPDPAAVLAARLRAEGHTISKPRRVLWDSSGFAVSVEDCPAPVEAVLFDFDEIAGPGILPAVQAVEGGNLQVQYAGRTFDRLDRAALYRLRLRNGAVGLLHGRLVDPPVILLFWPGGCAPKDIL
ncbi:MAG TPA: hypothetical protein VH722_05415 [Alphaproteobacteria bacterium]|jgi:hypothetical protein|nr:hypothetical protein [Alphaproteobacteria bacterium]